MRWLRIRELFDLVRVAAREWSQDRCLQLGAALAYYTIFSMAPLLVIVIAVAALVFGREAAEGELLQQFEASLGADAAAAVRGMIERASQPRTGWLATIGGLLMMGLGASSVFGQLQSAMNQIWNIPRSRGRGLRGLLVDRLTSFSMILVIGFLLLVSLVLSTAVAALESLLNELFPGAALFLQGLNLMVSFAVVTLLFAMIFKILPDARILWGDVWIGAAFTSLLFTLGKFAIAFYLARSTAASVYGAASSLVVVLLWVYYSSQILFFGAECTQVYARRYGSWRHAPQPGDPACS